MTVTVLIVDDHAVVRQGLQALLASRPDVLVVGEAADGAQAVQLRMLPDPKIIDVGEAAIFKMEVQNTDVV